MYEFRDKRLSKYENSLFELCLFMEEKLTQNEGKKNDILPLGTEKALRACVGSIYGETGEVVEALLNFRNTGYNGDEEILELKKELADVANYCLITLHLLNRIGKKDGY